MNVLTYMPFCPCVAVSICRIESFRVEFLGPREYTFYILIAMAVSIEGDHFFTEGRGQCFKALDSNGQTAFPKSVTCFYSHQPYSALSIPPTQ